ncbi:MAG: hypothetical protein EOO61_09255 [Hymenobacter sp.]|nr:MAG: hypothetical protein EOO61_09255 [Hymenobacter sp.]
MAQHNFSAMTVAELFALKDKYSQEGNLQALLDIALYRFGRGSIAMFKSIFPEISFLYGAMHRIDELRIFLQDNKLALALLPISYRNLAEKMGVLGYKYPQMEMSDSNYLDAMLKDPDMHETVDTILKISLSILGEYRHENNL